ncbi:hypothetical protein [Pseudanabaena sp. UWO310]|uniref:hypothetical protein n=1 Tax=Pseudanabaena sp. UWO310 TaxID=2480795 RepID=UPI00116106B6|nr:hypothetical protein [Pseudanabaena sp. UWO310]TYQ23951.1 hypothetical protein PseudUWO310_21555 [Pseudanabaena sp. UWO310]
MKTIYSKIPSSQWDAITNYAKNYQFLPTALYVTAFGGEKGLDRKIEEKGIERGIIVYVATFLPDLSF